MVIGYDASRAFDEQRTGTETYSYQLLKSLASIECQGGLRAYVRPDCCSGKLSGVELFPIKWQRMWTQGGLAWETWVRPPDVLFIPAHVVPFLRNPRVPVVVTVHDLALEYLDFYSNPLQRFYLGWGMERLRARLATRIISVSHSTKRDLVSKLRISDSKVEVVYEGVDPRYRDSIRKEEVGRVRDRYNIEGEYVFFVSTIQPRKNVEGLIGAFASLKSHFPRLKLVLAGKPGWDYQSIYQAPRDYDLEGEVLFLGFVPQEDLPALYRGAGVFCLPSFHEGFGIPVLEAMSVGTPVVTSRVSSLPEVGGDVAVYVDPYDIDDIARGLKSVLEWSSEERTRRATRGKKWSAKFTWQKAAARTLALLQELVN